MPSFIFVHFHISRLVATISTKVKKCTLCMDILLSNDRCTFYHFHSSAEVYKPNTNCQSAGECRQTTERIMGIHIFYLLSLLTTAVLIGANPVASPQASEQDTYTAAVVEFSTDFSFDVLFRVLFRTLTRQEAVHVMMSNLKSFKNLATEAGRNGADIIVFPEYGLNGFLFPSRAHLLPFLEEIPDPWNGSYIPCGDSAFANRPILSYLSCLALTRDIALVVNMGEKQRRDSCADSAEKCPPDGWYMYNTNVVFDKDGSLIAKYHKTNLYGNEILQFDTPPHSPHTVFTTSFGVSFGTFTCLDILYCQPPLELVATGIRNFVFPTAWGNSFPFYTSIGFQQAWSWRTGSNLLASNQHFPKKNSFPEDIRFYLTGSGIFTAGEAVSTFISGENFPPATGQLVMGTLPKQPVTYGKERSRRVEKGKLGGTGEGGAGLKYDVGGIVMKTSRYLNFSLLDTTELGGDLAVSYTSPDGSLNLHCSLQYTRISQDTSETYALGAYIGASPRDPLFHYAVCSLVKCPTSDIVTCGRPTEGYLAHSVFEKVKLFGSFPEGSVVFPVTLLSGLELVSPADVVLGEKGLTMEGVGKPLLSASLWSRIYPGESETYSCGQATTAQFF